jgi:hypothetical protein
MSDPVKHDLSANEAKISFNLLLQTAQIAVGGASHECERALGSFQSESFKSNYDEMMFAARNLARSAKQLATATDTLQALMESQTREDFVIMREDVVAK